MPLDHVLVLRATSAVTDPLSINIPGSRQPISVPAQSPASSSTLGSNSEPSTSPFTTASSNTFTSTRRRKPTRTYQAPSVDHSVGLRIEDSAYSNTSVMRTNAFSDNRPSYGFLPQRAVAKRASPPLPLYHPLAPLALSLPDLDPALFGLPNSLTVDDTDPHSDAVRRSSSRARRPAAKLRDRDHTDDHPTPLPPQPDVTPTPERDSARSPRKRRAGGGNGASGTGSKRKRKDIDDGDATYPNPAKRTRNPRSVAPTASPLASVVPDADAEIAEPDASSTTVEQPDVIENEPLPQPAAESQTSAFVKPRDDITNKRRNSSASETTTTSVSIATANMRPVAESIPDPPVIPPVPIQEDVIDRNVHKREEEELEEEPSDANLLMETTSIIEPAPQTSAASLNETGEIVQDIAPEPQLAKAAQKEEREEGELSDEAA